MSENDLKDMRAVESEPNYCYRVLSGKGHFLGSVVNVKALAAEVGRLQGMSPIALYYAAEALSVAALLSSDHAKHQSIQLKIEGDGALGGQFIDVLDRQEIRLKSKTLDPDIAQLEKAFEQQQSPYGNGILSVTKISRLSKNPSVGSVSLKGSTLAHNVASFLRQSEQIEAAVGIQLQLSKPEILEVAMAQAWGFMIKKLPNTPDAAVQQIEQKLSGFKTQDFSEDPLEVFSYFFEDEGYSILEKYTLKRFCRCDPERFKEVLKGISKTEILEMAAGTGSLEIKCEFCCKKYEISLNELGVS